MAYSVNWETKIITIPKSDLIDLGNNIYKLDLEECHRELRRLEWEFDAGLTNDQILDYVPPLEAGGVIYARFVLLINNYKIEFEDGQYAVNLVGANTNLQDNTIVNQVSVRPTNSAGLQDLSVLLASAYQGEVVIDTVKGQSGTSIPIGTLFAPVNNLADAREIMKKNGITKLRVIGNLDLVAGDNASNIIIDGGNSLLSTITVSEDADINDTEIHGAMVQGKLGDNCKLSECLVVDLTDFNGLIVDSELTGTISLSSTKNLTITNSSSKDITNPPIIDFNGSNRTLSVLGWSGSIELHNCTDSSTKASIGVETGEVVIDSSCTAGTINVGGTGILKDNSGANCYVINTMVDGSDIHNIQKTVEYLRPHHIGSGEIYFWDPYGGNDNWDGRTANRAVKTFAKAHSLTTNANHDIIVCISGNPNGLTIATESITISNDYTFLRGSGRDFELRPTTGDTITITGRGAEVSGMRIKSLTGQYAIKATNVFPLIQNTYISGDGNGIHIDNVDFPVVTNNTIRDLSGNGIVISGTSNEVTIKDNKIHNCSASGIIIEGESETNVTNCNIFDNTTYGIDIQNIDAATIIDHETNIFRNGVEQIHDNSTKTLYIDIPNDTVETLMDYDPGCAP